MLTKQKIMQAVNALLAARYPDADIHVNREPADFTRPAFLIMAPRHTVQTLNRDIVAETVYITITCFAEVDGHGNSDAARPSEMQEGVLELFRRGYITVEDRAVKVQAGGGGQDLDRAWVDVTCEYREVRVPNPPQPPLMQHIETTMTGGN